MTDGSRVYSYSTQLDPDALSIISASPSIWLSLETSPDRARRPSDSLGPVKVDSGASQTRSILAFSGIGPVVVSNVGELEVGDCPISGRKYMGAGPWAHRALNRAEQIGL